MALVRFHSFVAPLAVLLLGACSHGPRPLTAEQQAAITEMKTREGEVVALVNAHRAEKGLPPLQVSGYVTAVARHHSQEMADGVVSLGHAGFEGRAATIMQEFSYKEIGENIQYGDSATTTTLIVKGWLSLPEQRAEIEGHYDYTGVGVARSSNGTYYYTQLFVLRGKK